MKITGGRFRGIKLNSPRGLDIRPTSEKMRQAFFNIIQNYVHNCYFYDICCGTGLMGLEALSRGAEFCTFIDNGKESSRIVNKSIEKLKVGDVSVFISENAVSALKSSKLPKNYSGPSIVYFDPPYDHSKLYSLIMTQVSRVFSDYPLIFALEHPKEKVLPEFPAMELWKEKTYGNKKISMFTNKLNV